MTSKTKQQTYYMKTTVPEVRIDLPQRIPPTDKIPKPTLFYN